MEVFYYDKLLVTYLTRCIAKYLFLLTYLRAHNPKVGGSNPSPATKTRPSVSKEKLGVFAILDIPSGLLKKAL